MTSQPDFLGLSKLVRYHILTCTSAAGSGHPTTYLSATDLITVLFFGHLKYDLDNPQLPNNDRLIFSKGHAAPLYFSLFAAAGKISEKEMLDLRKFDSPLEGHPTPRFVHAEVAAGSLGQGLSIGVGMAINAKFLDKLPYRTFVLMGDGEMAEGSVWEAAQLASHYKLDNLIAFVDVNRLGQSRDTMAGHDVDSYANKLRAFGWEVVTLDGHDLEAISKGYNTLFKTTGKPKAIVAKTLKGKGVSFLEDKEGWHGKALKQADLEKALWSCSKARKLKTKKTSHTRGSGGVIRTG
jgi:transketolase